VVFFSQRRYKFIIRMTIPKWRMQANVLPYFLTPLPTHPSPIVQSQQSLHFVTSTIPPYNGVTFVIFPFVCPFCFEENSLLARTDAARSSRTSIVDSQLMHASVILTPFFKPARPSAGTFWLPSLMLDSIITPMMDFSPARSCSPTTVATLGWLRWSLLELPVEFVSARSQI